MVAADGGRRRRGAQVGRPGEGRGGDRGLEALLRRATLIQPPGLHGSRHGTGQGEVASDAAPRLLGVGRRAGALLCCLPVVVPWSIKFSGKYHGVLLIPEGLIESILEMYALIQEINILYSNKVPKNDIPSQLSPWAAALFKFLPPFIRTELLLHQESDNSAQLSQIDTEKLLAHLVEAEMNKRTKEGKYKGRKFSSVCHFFGYQGRGSLPSNFDCNYAYAMMSVRRQLRGPGVVPIGKPAIHPCPIDMKGEAYAVLREKASSFLLDDFYRTPGGIQFDGPGADAKPITLTVEDQNYLGNIEILQDYLDKVRAIVKPRCSRDILKAVISSMASVNNVLKVMSAPLSAELPLYHFN